MTVLDLHDIQGIIVKSYGRMNYPVARFFFLRFADEVCGRKFLREIRPRIATAAPWPEGWKPPVAVNIGFTFFGLWTLGLPTRLLQRLPEAFVDGMKSRALMLGDRDPAEITVDKRTEAPDRAWNAHWDEIWRRNRPAQDVVSANNVHAIVIMNAQVRPGTDRPVPELDEETTRLVDLVASFGDDVVILTGHGGDPSSPYQAASALFTDMPDGSRMPLRKDHFGYTDAIGDPVFAGQYPPEMEKTLVIGRGKWMKPEVGWEPIATGEFLLGHPDESQELPTAAPPPAFMRNGSFLVYRKLHQYVDTHRRVLTAEAEQYARVFGVPHDEALETVSAKTVGRWRDGVPLSHAPTYAAWRDLQHRKGFDNPATAPAAYHAYFKSAEPSDFRFNDDTLGVKCPLGAHLRRVNTRDMLDPEIVPGARNEHATTRLNNRRRILRRGLPYGPNVPDSGSDDGEQGTIFMAICADIFRQFEFIQQQWLEYGLDFNTGNTTCPLVGRKNPGKRHVIQADPDGETPPYIMSKLETFVEARGGEYFFMPSMSGLRLMAMGVVDPT